MTHSYTLLINIEYQIHTLSFATQWAFNKASGSLAVWVSGRTSQAIDSLNLSMWVCPKIYLIDWFGEEWCSKSWAKTGESLRHASNLFNRIGYTGNFRINFQTVFLVDLFCFVLFLKWICRKERRRKPFRDASRSPLSDSQLTSRCTGMFQKWNKTR